MSQSLCQQLRPLLAFKPITRHVDVGQKNTRIRAPVEEAGSRRPVGARRPWGRGHGGAPSPRGPRPACPALARSARSDARAGGARRGRRRAGLNLVRARETAGPGDEVSAAELAHEGLGVGGRETAGWGDLGPQHHSVRMGRDRTPVRLAALRRPRESHARSLPSRTEFRGPPAWTGG